MADDWNSLQSTFGLNAQDIANLKTQGMNPNSATEFLTKGIGGNTLMQGPGGMSLSQLISLGSMFGGKGGAGGTGDGNMAGGGLRNYQTVGVDPNQPLTNLGAAALNQNAVYNPQPGAGTGGDTGVTGSGGSGFAGGGGLTIGGVSTTQPRITTSGVVPNVQPGPWTRTPGMFVSATGAVTPGTQIAQPQKPGQQPTQQDPNYRGPTQVTLPSAFGVPQPTAALPVTPTPQATGMAYRPGQSWATPPPAPPITAIQSATGMQYAPGRNLAQASAPSGIPAGGGGVAGSAIALGTGGPPPAPGGPIKRMQSGGVVTQPTMAMIGENGPEAVLPLSDQDWTPQQRAMLSQLIRAVTQSGDVNPNLTASLNRPSPLRPAAGPNPQLRTPIPTPESNVVAGQQYPPPQRQPPQQRPPQQRPQQMPPAQPSSAQDYADWANSQRPGQKPGVVYDASGNIVSSSPGLTAQAAAGRGATMDASGAIRDASGLVYDSSANLAAQDVGGAGATMPAGGAASGATTGGAGGMGSAISGGIGAIGGALQSLFSPSNIPSWKTQASAIPAAPSSNRYTPNYKFATQDVTNWNQLPEHLRPTDIYT